jgi:glycosyltransferase involved in cell wall biosynthesis
LFLTTSRLEGGSGGAERTLSIHAALAKLAEVHVLVVVPPNAPFRPRLNENAVRLLDDERDATTAYWRKRNYLLRDFRPDARVVSAVRVLHARLGFSAFVGRYQTPVLGACARLGPTFIDLDDLPTETTGARIPFWRVLRRKALQLSLRRMKHVFVAKRSDLLKVKHDSISVLPCISTQPDATGRVVTEGEPGRILLTGGMAWPPNREGALWFIDEVFPLVRRKCPEAVLRLVGVEGERVRGRPGVEAPGFVPDIAAEYRQAAICICPVLRGTGAPVKLAEAVGFGRATVATCFAARAYEGLLEPGRDLLVAGSPREFADRCIDLLTDRALRRAVAARGEGAARTRLSQRAIDGLVAATVGALL